MMKTLFNIFLLLAIANTTSAQTSENFSYQAIIRDAAGSLVIETNVSIRLSILKDTEMGTVVYSETHNPSTNFAGVVTLMIGDGTVVSGVLSAIDWGTSPYFIKSETDPTGGTNYDIVGTTAILSAPYGLSSKKTEVALSVDYNNLTNSPTTITAAQLATLDFLNVTGTTNLDQIESAVAINTSKIAFPGFGTTAGTAFDIIWSKIDDHLYYDTGKVGIGYTDTSGFGEAVLGVKDGMVLSLGDGEINPTPGVLFYDKSAKGFVFYYDNAGVLQSLGTDQIDFNTESNIFNVDGVIKSRAIVGSAATTGVDFGENDLILASSTPSIYFDDTSNTGSFPNRDWLIKINDYFDNGENYFAVLDTTAALTSIPFKVMAAAPHRAMEVSPNGNVSIGNVTATERLELEGTVSAVSYVGSGENLTNLSGVGTASTTNTGSTTIGADTDGDDNGAIFLNTLSSGLFIESDGTVHNGVADPSYLLNISGDLQFDSLTTTGLSVGTALESSVFTELNANNFARYDVTNKGVVLFNNSASVSVSGFFGGVKGQKVCFINIHPTNTVTLSLPGNDIAPVSMGTNPILSQNESLTMIYDGSRWIYTDYVVSP